MSASAKVIRGYRCPVCMLNSKDPHLRYDRKKEEYFCQSCGFTGQEEEILRYYDVFRSKYRQLNSPLNLKQI